MWPAEGRWVSEAFIDVGTTLSCIELLQSGVTCVNDMYFFPDTMAQVMLFSYKITHIQGLRTNRNERNNRCTSLNFSNRLGQKCPRIRSKGIF
jgi:hypothetical protein